ncbi:MAG TPA: helix-turn-helix transcriptional regulator [bacterium]|nr:helix-turn-helix transcriptional regulator [bacterium]
MRPFPLLQPAVFVPSANLSNPALTVREALGPAFERASRLADGLQVPRTTFYGWVNGRRTIPPETFVRLANELKLSDTSRAFYAFYRRELDAYFTPRFSEDGGDVRLVTKRGERERGHAIDMESIRRFGFARVMYEARVRKGLSLDQVADLINELPRKKKTGRKARGDILSQYEKSTMIPQEGHNRVFLDYLIEALELDPSEAYLAAGRPWVTDFIRVHDRTPWRRLKSAAPTIGSLQTAPYEARMPAYEPFSKPRATHKREATGGLGTLLRQARLLTGLGLEEASNASGVAVQSLKNFEIHGLKPDFMALSLLARAYGAAIVHLYPYFKDPMFSLIIAHNAYFHPDVDPERFMTERGPLYLSCRRDAQAATALVPLPSWNFRRRYLALRLAKGWSREETGERLSVYEKATNKIEDTDQPYFPSWDLVRALAKQDGETEAALQVWRESAQKTFYPQVPWEFLQTHRIFPAGPHDVTQLQHYLDAGTALEDRLGWRLFKLRLGLEINETRQEAADRYGISKSALTDAELERRPTQDKLLDKIAEVRGVDAGWLKSLKRVGQASVPPPEPVPENPFPHARKISRKSVPAGGGFGRLLTSDAEYAVFEPMAGYRDDPQTVLDRIAETVLGLLSSEQRLIVRNIPLLPKRVPWFQGVFLQRLRDVPRENFQIVLSFNDALVEIARQDGALRTVSSAHETASDDELYRFQELRLFLGE